MATSAWSWRAAARLLAAVLLLYVAPQADALVFINEQSVTDPDFNTAAPTGAFAGSGWQHVGSLGGIVGVPVGPRHFLAAQHIGGAVGLSFVLNGTSYHTVASFEDPGSDLRLWQIDGTFPSFAPLYRNANEEGRPMVVHGRGGLRGSEVRANGTGALRGWQWAASDGRLRWGANRVATYASLEQVFGAKSINRNLLYANFNNNSDADAAVRANEAQAAGGDSSGAVFIDDGGGWKLAGVVYAVLCCYGETQAGPRFQAAIFDMRGLYLNETLVSWPSALPGFFASSRVSQRLGWIDSILARLPQSIDFPPLGDRGIDGAAVSLQASASSGLAVAFVASTPQVCTVSGSTATLVALGTCTVQASQAGDATYLPATPVTRSFEVVTGSGGGTSSPGAVVPFPNWALAVLAVLLAAAAVTRRGRRAS
jgi:hypothetical protein